MLRDEDRVSCPSSSSPTRRIRRKRDALEVEAHAGDDPIVDVQAVEEEVRVEDDVAAEEEDAKAGHGDVEPARPGEEDADERRDEEDHEGAVQVRAHRVKVVLGLRAGRRRVSARSASTRRRMRGRGGGGGGASDEGDRGRTWSVKSVKPRKTNVVMTSASRTTSELKYDTTLPSVTASRRVKTPRRMTLAGLECRFQ